MKMSKNDTDNLCFFSHLAVCFFILVCKFSLNLFESFKKKQVPPSQEKNNGHLSKSRKNIEL